MAASMDLSPGAHPAQGRGGGASSNLQVPSILDRMDADRRALSTRRERHYLTPYLRAVRFLDLLAVSIAVGLAHLLRFGLDHRDVTTTLGSLDYVLVSVGLVVGWMSTLHLQRSYDGRLVGHGVQEYRQVFRASVWLFAALAILALAFKFDFARGYVLLAFPLGTLMLLTGRWGARKWLVRERRENRLCDRVLVVGEAGQVTDLVVALERTPDAGYQVVGACVDSAERDLGGVPVLGHESEVLVHALAHEVDVVAVASPAGLGRDGLRRLGWALENTQIGLVVAPGIMDVAGPRVLTRPVQGLPLIHVESPRFEGPHLVAKNILDRGGAALLLLLLSPLFLLVGALIKLEDKGPALFRQERVGREGDTFLMLKFRTMVEDAEDQLPSLAHINEGSGPLFKLRDDPRVTRIGATLRKYSLDELPQLLNVLKGEMSLVGPRPPLPREVAEYEAHVRRRLLVKPGMTGLWQINGRSDLAWEETVRLDLYYVENWTPVLDLMILWRTVQVVVNPDSKGAY